MASGTDSAFNRFKDAFFSADARSDAFRRGAYGVEFGYENINSSTPGLRSLKIIFNRNHQLMIIAKLGSHPQASVPRGIAYSPRESTTPMANMAMQPCLLHLEDSATLDKTEETTRRLKLSALLLKEIHKIDATLPFEEMIAVLHAIAPLATPIEVNHAAASIFDLEFDSRVRSEGDRFVAYLSDPNPSIEIPEDFQCTPSPADSGNHWQKYELSVAKNGSWEEQNATLTRFYDVFSQLLEINPATTDASLLHTP